jgi:hypothetical protein
MTRHTLSLVFLLTIAFAGCRKPKNATYRSAEDRITLTLISTDECELRINKITWLGKYTKQPDALRVILPTLGSHEVRYFKIVKDGLQQDDGELLYSAAAIEKRGQVIAEYVRKAKADKALRDAQHPTEPNK